MKTGLSSILTQLDPETQQHQVVGYHSRSTTPQEQRYSKIEIENAVIEFGVTKNYICLYWLPEFSIIRYHKPLVSIYSAFQRQPPPRILKHKLRIQGYNYTLQYEQGGAAIWQTTSPDTPRTCTKRSMPWKWRRKTLLMPLCGPVYRQPLPSKKYSRQCAMTRKCKYYHNLFWTDISLNKTNQPGYHASTPAKNLPHQITSH